MTDIILGYKGDGAGSASDHDPSDPARLIHGPSYTQTYTAGHVIKEIGIWLQSNTFTKELSTQVGIYNITDGIEGAPLVYSGEITKAENEATGRYFVISPNAAPTGLLGGETLALAIGPCSEHRMRVPFVSDSSGVAANDVSAYELESSWATSGTTGTVYDFYAILGESVTTPTTRKGSTFDAETTLSGTVTAATLNSVDVSDHITGQTGTTVSFDGGLTAETTTSGEYDLVLTDDSADPDETIAVQVNVVGLPSNTAKKDGGLLISLTDLTLDAINASGTVVKQLTGITTDASGVISPVDLSDISEAVGDTLKVSLHSAASDVGVTFEQALENI